MTAQDEVHKAFDFALETSKQVSLLATGIITVTVAFLGDLKKAFPGAAFCDLHVAWIFDAFSVLFGVLTMMALTGHIGSGKPTVESIYASNVRVLFALQLLTFLVALGFTVAFGIATT